MTSRSAIEIANWFIENANGREMSNLKIQKLMYAAFGIHFANFDKHLFYDPIEAWRLGPVVPSVYHCLKIYGSQDIPSRIELPGGMIPSVDPSDKIALWSLETVMARIGDWSAYQLVAWSHRKGGPWDQVYDERRINEISKASIRRDVFRSESAQVPGPRLA